MAGVGSWPRCGYRWHTSSIMRIVETLGQFSSNFGQARLAFAVEEMSIAQTDIVSTMLNLLGKVFHSSPGKGQVRGPQLSSLPSLDNHLSKPVLCWSGWDKAAFDQQILNITFISFFKKCFFGISAHLYPMAREAGGSQGCSCLVSLTSPLAGRRAHRLPKRCQIAVEVSGCLVGVKWKATPRRRRGGTFHRASGFTPSHGDANHPTPDISPDCSRDKETIKDITVNQPLINYNRIRSPKGHGNRSELSNSVRKIAVCSWWVRNVSASKTSVMSLSQNVF